MPVSEKPETIQRARQRAAGQLSDASETPRRDAELLLREILGLDRMQMIVQSDRVLSPGQHEAFERLIQRRVNGEPVAYILGRRGFRSIELAVDWRVMVPRPETERLIDLALEQVNRRSDPLRVVDVGTGSGAIALALATELPANRTDVEIVASDVSADALDVARRNRDALGLGERVDLRQADLLAGLGGRFAIILANLPYLRPDQHHPSTVREPDLALYAGTDGFDLYRRFFVQLPDVLATGGVVIVEIDPSQAEFGPEIVTRRTELPARVVGDLSGRARFLMVEDAGSARLK